jgi:NTE family protein
LGVVSRIIIFIIFVNFSFPILGQKVGLVLSGGGAQALSHIGVLKALEERHINVDYIVGTSMGSVIGAMYASGMTVAEMEAYVTSDDYRKMSEGIVGIQFQNLFHQASSDASMLSVRLGGGESVRRSIPTHLISPEVMDWETMIGFSAANYRCQENFDSLMIPFRCLASDVETKQSVVFRSGSLSQAVRASMTYPFYIPAITVDGKLMFDGGIYNNFPLDVMYQTFMPDVIIGSNVSGVIAQPKEDDFFSQIESLIVYREINHHPCPESIEIRPDVSSFGTFSFNNAQDIIQEGYLAAVEQLSAWSGRHGSIVLHHSRVLEEKRRKFLSKPIPSKITSIEIEGLEEGESIRVRKGITAGLTQVDFKGIEERYYALWRDQRINKVFPISSSDTTSEDGGYLLKLKIKKELPALVTIGGNFSSRSINTGMIALQYQPFKNRDISIYGNSYFGRFYGSALVGSSWATKSFRFPSSFAIEFTQNRWDFYRSVSAFFEDVKPSFVLINEMFFQGRFRLSTSQHSIFQVQSAYTHQFDKYYQTKQFLSVDTADVTEFDGWIHRLSWEYNTLNRKQYASEGSLIKIGAKNAYGRELSIPGSTSFLRDTAMTWHNWISFKVNGLKYWELMDGITFLTQIGGGWSNLNAFNNFTGTIMQLDQFNAIPEASTFFMSQFRGLFYSTTGFGMVLSWKKRFDLRLEYHRMDSWKRYVFDANNKVKLDFQPEKNIQLSGSVVFQTPVGPLSFQLNYFERNTQPVSALFHFGYILFNDSPRN